MNFPVILMINVADFPVKVERIMRKIMYLSKEFVKNAAKEAREQTIFNELMDEARQRNKRAKQLLNRLEEIEENLIRLKREGINCFIPEQKKFISQVNRDVRKSLEKEREQIFKDGEGIGKPRAYLLKRLVQKKTP